MEKEGRRIESMATSQNPLPVVLWEAPKSLEPQRCNRCQFTTYSEKTKTDYFASATSRYCRTCIKIMCNGVVEGRGVEEIFGPQEREQGKVTTITLSVVPPPRILVEPKLTSLAHTTVEEGWFTPVQRWALASAWLAGPRSQFNTYIWDGAEAWWKWCAKTTVAGEPSVWVARPWRKELLSPRILEDGEEIKVRDGEVWGESYEAGWWDPGHPREGAEVEAAGRREEDEDDGILDYMQGLMEGWSL
jgi:hypothetical protein